MSKLERLIAAIAIVLAGFSILMLLIWVMLNFKWFGIGFFALVIFIVPVMIVYDILNDIES